MPSKVYVKAKLLKKSLVSLAITVVFSFVLAVECLALENDPVAQTVDPRYGMALYEFYQRNYYEALTELAIANIKELAIADENKVISDDVHQPQIMKGAMYLSFGLHDYAKDVFEDLLIHNANIDSADSDSDSDSDLAQQPPLTDRSISLIWFYLGKVFYQLGNNDVAYSALQRLDIEQLQDYQAEIDEANSANPSLNKLLDDNVVDEYHYMMGELFLGQNNIELARQHLKDINLQSPWVIYLNYNLALTLKNQGLLTESQSEFETIIQSNFDIDTVESEPELESESVIDQETEALQDRIYLTRGFSYIEQSQFKEAMVPLEKIRLDGPLSDQALFSYGLAATHARDYLLAMGALRALTKKQSVNPVIYESYFAVGYLYEQMGKKTDALAAYKIAADYYENVLNDLEKDLSHEDKHYLLDRYFTEQPSNVIISSLFSKVHFQLAVKNVRELDALEISFSKWLKKVDSFEVMIDTRKLARDQRIKTTTDRLNNKDVKSITLQRNELATSLSEKSESESLYFFLNEEQKDNLRLINKVKGNVESYSKKLTALGKSNGEYADYLARIKRVESYFYWQASENFPIKRWEAQGGLNSLDGVLAELEERTNKLGALVNRSKQIEVLEQRIALIKPRLLSLHEQTNHTLQRAKDELRELIVNELQDQAERVGHFLAQASLAQARITDEMLEGQADE